METTFKFYHMVLNERKEVNLRKSIASSVRLAAVFKVSNLSETFNLLGIGWPEQLVYLFLIYFKSIIVFKYTDASF